MPVEPPRFAPTPSWQQLRHRAGLRQQIRGYFDTRGFLEVETPLLSTEVIAEPHIEPIAVSCEGRTRWLQASPEAHMKRLLAAGSGPIYQLTRAFREGEVGPLHNPEFTILEWYHAAADVDEGLAFLAEFAEAMTGLRPVVVSYRELFARHAGIDPLAADDAELSGRARLLDCPIDASPGWSRDDWLEWLLVAAVEPHLGGDTAWIIRDYPPTQAALAAIGSDPLGSPVASRFELYVRGVELANGYYELTDPDELRERLAAVRSSSSRPGRPPLPESQLLLEAVQQGLPPTAGVALGFDRLALVTSGAETLGEVITFTWGRA